MGPAKSLRLNQIGALLTTEDNWAGTLKEDVGTGPDLRWKPSAV